MPWSYPSTWKRTDSLGLRYDLGPCRTSLLQYLLNLHKVSNISDSGYVGIQNSLAALMPLLQSPRINQHATLISLFLNAVVEMVHNRKEGNSLPNMDRLLQYLPRPDLMKLARGNSADTMRMWDARTLVMDAENHFQE